MTEQTHTDDGTIDLETNMVRGTVAEGDSVTVYIDSVHDSFDTVEGEVIEVEYTDPEEKDKQRDHRKLYPDGDYPDPWGNVVIEDEQGRKRSFAYTIGEDDQVKELLNQERSDRKTPTMGDIMGVVVDSAREDDEDEDAPEVAADGGLGRPANSQVRLVAQASEPLVEVDATQVEDPLEPMAAAGAKATDVWVVHTTDGEELVGTCFRIAVDGSAGIHPADPRDRVSLRREDIARVEWYGDADGGDA